MKELNQEFHPTNCGFGFQKVVLQETEHLLSIKNRQHPIMYMSDSTELRVQIQTFT